MTLCPECQTAQPYLTTCQSPAMCRVTSKTQERDMTLTTEELRETLEKATPGPWVCDVHTSGATIYTLRPAKWAGLDALENAWQAQFSQDGSHKTPLAEVQANAWLSSAAPDLAAEVLALRAENERLRADKRKLSQMCEHAIRLIKAGNTRVSDICAALNTSEGEG